MFVHSLLHWSPARALNRHLEWKYEGVPWPSVSMLSTDLPNYMIKRINEASVSQSCPGGLRGGGRGITSNTVLAREKLAVQYFACVLRAFINTYVSVCAVPVTYLENSTFQQLGRLANCV